MTPLHESRDIPRWVDIPDAPGTWNKYRGGVLRCDFSFEMTDKGLKFDGVYFPDKEEGTRWYGPIPPDPKEVKP